MSGTLTHSPARVLQEMFINLALGVRASYDTNGKYNGGSWPVFYSNEPDVPDKCLTLTDTAGQKHGREMIGGEVLEDHGVQVRVRADTHDNGWTKARAVATFLDEDVYQENVTISGKIYLVHAIMRAGDVLAIGAESPTSKRRIFTINLLATIRQTN